MFDIDEARRLGQQATQPPWDAVKMWNWKERAFVVHHDTVPNPESWQKFSNVFDSLPGCGGHAKEADADFVAYARNHWDEMVSMIDEAASQLMEVGEQLERVTRLGKQIAANNTMLRKIAAHISARTWMKAKEDAGFGTEIQAQISDPCCDEEWFAYVMVPLHHKIKPDE